MPTTSATRELGAAVSDVRYAVIYGELNERFWTRIDTALSLVSAIGGSAAVATFLAQSNLANAVAGAVLALAGVLGLVLRPGQKASQFREARIGYLNLLGRAWSMQVGEVDAERARLEAAAPIGLDGLGPVAWNRLVIQLGDEDRAQGLTTWQSVLAWIA
ncbi:hypothetical protein KAK07_23550 [Ideonella sp. 4Y16]|uniref:SMODS and SLOG-associating 2TM effector domain-containing protein n=1 Tax=Ideonella aquatica TaxID=2824119 RepID=A0A940YP64_9BURK|nr:MULTISPECIES: hypothetical protein [Ideonella]MBQ0946335.1 hypothetical protein [Ideonella alba]MBQ0960457.1 hypothetical protein [Ideonella aquatica]